MKCLEVHVWSLVCCENPKLHRSIYCIISCWDKMVKNINLLCNNCKTVWKLYKVAVLYGCECIQSMINYSEDKIKLTLTFSSFWNVKVSSLHCFISSWMKCLSHLKTYRDCDFSSFKTLWIQSKQPEHLIDGLIVSSLIDINLSWKEIMYVV